ncbi:MAG: iron ABC transporter permease [Xanthobacteraceae bacterium]
MRRVFLRRRTSSGAVLLALFAASFVTLPLISLVRLALDGDPELWPHLASNVLPVASLQTIALLGGVAIVAGVAGTGSAWLVTAFRFPGRTALIWLLPLPLAFPAYIASYVYVDLLDAAGPVQEALRRLVGWQTAQQYWFPPVRSLPGAILIMSFVLYPYVYLSARAMFETQGAAFIDAARTLGARPWPLLRDIVLPMARPALAVGVSLALLEVLNDIGASEYLGVQTLTLSVFTTWLNRNSLGGAAQIAIAMLIIVAAVIWLERSGRRRQAYHTTHDGRRAEPIHLTGGKAVGALALCLLPVLLGFIIPALFLLREAIRGLITIGIDPALPKHALTTVMLSGVATLLVLALGFGCAIALRLTNEPWVRFPVAVAAVGYAIPGTVLALGLLGPLVLLDDAVNALAGLFTRQSVGLVFAGTSAALVIAYTARYLAIALGLAQAGLARIAAELDDVARLAGASPVVLARTVHVPLIRPALGGAALLVCVDCLKELPMTLLLRPLNTETLATYLYQYATRGSFEDGALAALLIVLAGLLPVVWLVRLTESRTDWR